MDTCIFTGGLVTVTAILDPPGETAKLSFLAHLPGSNKCSALVASTKKAEHGSPCGLNMQRFRKTLMTDCISLDDRLHLPTCFPKNIGLNCAKGAGNLAMEVAKANASSVLDETMFKTRTTA